MPIYEYRCENGHLFEVLQKITDDPVVACESCEAPVQRVFHPIAVHFKGSGFYNTDYGTAKRKREEAASKSGTDTDSRSGGGDKKGADKQGGGSASGGDGSSSSSTSSSSSSGTAD